MTCARPVPLAAQLPPHDRRAERRLLAALLREPQLVTEACLHHGVTEADLYFHAHRLIWNAAWSLVDSGAVPDLVTVYQTLQCRDELRELDPVNPALWLADLFDADPTGAWADWCCQLVKWNAERRHAIHRANEILRDAYDGCREPEFYAKQLGNGTRGQVDGYATA